MKVRSHRIDDVTVLVLSGSSVLGAPTESLKEIVRSVLLQGSRHILLNFRDVAFLDSAGIGDLVMAHALAWEQGAVLKLCHVGARVQRSLEIAQLMGLFHIFPGEQEALRAFLPS